MKDYVLTTNPCCQAQYGIAKMNERVVQTAACAASIPSSRMNLGTRCPGDILVKALVPAGPDNHNTVLPDQ